MLSWEFHKIFRTPILKNTGEWLPFIKTMIKNLGWYLVIKIFTAPVIIRQIKEWFNSGFDKWETERSSHHRCSVTKSVLRNFAKFTEKHMCQGLYFNKFAGWIWYRCFPVNFTKFPRITFLKNTSGRLPLERNKYFSTSQNKHFFKFSCNS